MLTANRSYVLFALKKHSNQLKGFKMLQPMRKSYLNYIEALGIDRIEIKQEQLEHLQSKAFKETAWLQLVITLKFWIDDSSPAFEKTDIFIEKSINTSFDLIDTKPFKSLIDFGKFIFKEKFQTQ